jgi:hypothetical protein
MSIRHNALSSDTNINNNTIYIQVDEALTYVRTIEARSILTTLGVLLAAVEMFVDAIKTVLYFQNLMLYARNMKIMQICVGLC